MLYDEPTAGLDPITSKKINELIIALRDIKRVTGVFVTHRMRDAFTLATEYATNGDEQNRFHTEGNFLCIANTRFLMLRDGKIVFEGPDEVLRRSDGRIHQRFLQLRGGYMAQRRSLAWTELRVGHARNHQLCPARAGDFLHQRSVRLFRAEIHPHRLFPECKQLRSGAEVSLEGVTIGNVDRSQFPNSRDPKKAVEAVIENGLDDTRTSFERIPRSPSRPSDLLGDSKIDITRGTEAGRSSKRGNYARKRRR